MLKIRIQRFILLFMILAFLVPAFSSLAFTVNPKQTLISELLFEDIVPCTGHNDEEQKKQKPLKCTLCLLVFQSLDKKITQSFEQVIFSTPQVKDYFSSSFLIFFLSKYKNVQPRAPPYSPVI